MGTLHQPRHARRHLPDRLQRQHCASCRGPGVVAITYEMIHDTRVIPIGSGAHVGTAIRGYNGDSRGHWEGNTLVVDTTNFSDKTNFRGSRETLHIIERFTRDGDGIDYEVTVDDPTMWTKPWTAALTLAKQPDDSLFEYACHEGNNSMRNILSASRAARRRSNSYKRRAGPVGPALQRCTSDVCAAYCAELATACPPPCT